MGNGYGTGWVLRMTVAVIGAGVAGLACAGALQAAGRSVRVFDKARGPGGRLTTSRGPDWQGDMGAQYFTARDPAFREALEQWIAAGVAVHWQPRLVWLDRDGLEPVSDATDRYVGQPRMSALTRHLARGLELQMGVQVGSLRRMTRGIRLEDASGAGLGEYSKVVVAVPAPQAVALLDPIVPALGAQAAQAVMRPCWTLLLEPLTALDVAFDAAFVRAQPLSWMARDASKPGRDGRVWVMHADPEWSQQHEEAPAETVQEELLVAFRDLTGYDGPLKVRRVHRWRYASTARNLEEPFLLDSDIGLGACGDWCLGNRVEAAWRSGRAMAAALIGEAAA